VTRINVGALGYLGSMTQGVMTLGAMTLGVVALGAVALGAVAGNNPAAAQTTASVAHRNIALEERDRALVISFYDRVFNQHDLKAAESLLSEGYIQHNPRIPTGRAAFISFMADRLKQTPDTHSDIVRSAVEGGLVYLHVHAVNHPGERGTAIVNIFRVAGGKIVEHWDVVQPIPDNPANQNTMF
jgi:predicted SnoaL-like aldol condensation-catalyzing enzyme